MDPSEKTSLSSHAASLKDYIAIARFDHATKHVFLIPGVVLAWILRRPTHLVFLPVAMGLVTAVAIASANYVINEYLDRDFDRLHPTKSIRTSVRRRMRGGFVALEWLLLILIGLTCAYFGGPSMLLAACVFGLQGIAYNVRPFRTKDHAYIDVISESINNPVRLMIGWAMIDCLTIAPGSVILSYWFGGAFLMAAKRYSEYREISASHGRALLVSYRPSFAGYSDTSLNISCFIYALLSIFFLTVFLLKYRIEYLLLIPVICAMFGYYLAIAMRPGSSAQNPERLFKERTLFLIVIVLAGLFLFTSAADLPIIEKLSAQHFIRLR